MKSNLAAEMWNVKNHCKFESCHYCQNAGKVQMAECVLGKDEVEDSTSSAGSVSWYS